MIIFHKKNTRFDLAFPLVDGATPRLFNTGESITVLAYSQDGTGVWTLLTIADPATEIAATGIYEITLTAAEMNHDRVILKLTGGTTALDTMIEFDLSPNFAVFTLGPTSLGLNVDNFIGDPSDLGIFKKEAKSFALTILDSDGNAVDMTGKTLRFTVETIADPPVSKFAVTGGSITLSGDDSEIVNVAVTSTNSDLNATKYHWRLWDTVAEKLWQHGMFEIVDTSESAT